MIRPASLFAAAAFVVLPVVLPAALSAQTAEGGVVYEEETSFNFEDEYIDGQVVRPDGELIAGQRHGKESSLIRIRADFIPEMVRSVEEL
jgi:hypothetical protein